MEHEREEFYLSGDSPQNACRAMAAALFDRPDMRNAALNTVEAIIRKHYSEADLLALSPREMDMLSHATMSVWLDGFAMAVWQISTGYLSVELQQIEREP